MILSNADYHDYSHDEQDYDHGDHHYHTFLPITHDYDDHNYSHDIDYDRVNSPLLISIRITIHFYWCKSGLSYVFGNIPLTAVLNF